MRLVLAIAVMTIGVSDSWAQGPESVGIVMRLGSPGANGIRGYGMGNTMTASTDQSYNPAMILRDRPESSFRRGWTSADNLSFDVLTVEATEPLSSRRAVKVAYTDLQSSDMPSGMPGVSIGFSGKHLSVLYGQQVTDRLTTGVAAAIVLNSDVNVNSPLGQLASVSGRGKCDGGRIGLQYEISDHLRTAAHYDYYRVNSQLFDKVHAMTLGQDFRTSDLVLGAEYRSEDRWSFVAEIERGRFSGGPIRQKLRSYKFGAEYRPDNHWALRAGLADGQLTAGLVYKEGRHTTWSLAYMRNQYDSDLRPAIGRSETLYLAATAAF